jgi:hypothetical protein
MFSGLKYILYMSIILCICWLISDLWWNARYIQYEIRLHCLKKMVILVHCFNKGFLIKLSQLYFKHAYDLFSSLRVGDWPCAKSDTIPAGGGRIWIWPLSSRRVGHKPWTNLDMPLHQSLSGGRPVNKPDPWHDHRYRNLRCTAMRVLLIPGPSFSIFVCCCGEGPRSRCYGRTAALMLIVQPCDEDD